MILLANLPPASLSTSTIIVIGRRIWDAAKQKADVIKFVAESWRLWNEKAIKVALVTKINLEAISKVSHWLFLPFFRLQLTLHQRQKPRFRKQLVSGWLPFHHCTAVPVYWVGNRVSVEKVAAMILRNWRGNLVVLQVMNQNLNWRKGKVAWRMTTAYRNLQRKVRAFPAVRVCQVLRKSHQPQGPSVGLFRCRSWVHRVWFLLVRQEFCWADKKLPRESYLWQEEVYSRRAFLLRVVKYQSQRVSSENRVKGPVYQDM